MSLAVLLFCLQLHQSHSVPVYPLQHFQFISPRSLHINESTGRSDPAWVEGPTGRGTYEIIQSCAETLFLCGWTAVAINVHPSDSKGLHGLRRAWWMMITILAPEYVLWCAFDQFWTARRLRDEINGLGQNVVDEDGTKTHVSYLASVSSSERFPSIVLYHA